MSSFLSQLPGAEFLALLTSLAVAVWELFCQGCEVAYPVPAVGFAPPSCRGTSLRAV